LKSKNKRKEKKRKP